MGSVCQKQRKTSSSTKLNKFDKYVGKVLTPELKKEIVEKFPHLKFEFVSFQPGKVYCIHGVYVENTYQVVCHHETLAIKYFTRY